MDNTEHASVPAKRSDRSHARHGAVGMLWVGIALVFSKGFSFISQIVLGHVLPVETYAVFGLSATAVALIAGFQNASISKSLIQNHDRFELLFVSYSAFSFQFGILGAFILLVIGAVFEHFYTTPSLFLVLCLTSVSVPFLAINTTLVAALSVHYRFREINLTDMRRSVAYYSVLICAAVFGAGAYTMAVGAVAGAVVAHVLLLRASGVRPSYCGLEVREFVGIFLKLRWVLLSGFLVALAMRSDYFVVGKLLSAEELGFYTFGFMLVASLTLPITTGINQVLLPIFAKLQHTDQRLKWEVVRFSSAIVLLGGGLCILIMGLSSVLVHQVWGGKWDGAQIIINALVLSMPFRFLATISGVGFESTGRWGARNMILFFEALLLLTFTLCGAYQAGIEGAIGGVVLQRISSGIIGFTFFSRGIGISFRELILLFVRLFIPFLVAVVMLLWASPSRFDFTGGEAPFWVSCVETLISLAVFFLFAIFLNYRFIRVAVELILTRLPFSIGRG